MSSFRQKDIREILERDKIIKTADIAQKLGVTVETVRRDFDQLEKQGVLHKIYGGAVLYTESANLLASLETRRKEDLKAKAGMAAAAARYVTDDCIVALDAGSTVFELCAHLKGRKGLVIICNDVHAATELLSGSDARVYLMGGFLTKDGTSSGMFAKDFLNNIARIDYFICSTDGADLDSGLASDEEGINHLKKLYLKNARTSIALIGHSKFRKKGFYKLCDFSDLDLIITDSDTPAETVGQLRACGARVEIAEILLPAEPAEMMQKP